MIDVTTRRLVACVLALGPVWSCGGTSDGASGACAAVGCSEHGTCIVLEDGRAACICEVGFVAEGLTCRTSSDPQAPCDSRWSVGGSSDGEAEIAHGQLVLRSDVPSQPGVRVTQRGETSSRFRIEVLIDSFVAAPRGYCTVRLSQSETNTAAFFLGLPDGMGAVSSGAGAVSPVVARPVQRVLFELNEGTLRVSAEAGADCSSCATIGTGFEAVDQVLTAWRVLNMWSAGTNTQPLEIDAWREQCGSCREQLTVAVASRASWELSIEQGIQGGLGLAGDSVQLNVDAVTVEGTTTFKSDDFNCDSLERPAPDG